jgi:hypothetical protein
VHLLAFSRLLLPVKHTVDPRDSVSYQHRFPRYWRSARQQDFPVNIDMLSRVLVFDVLHGGMIKKYH